VKLVGLVGLDKYSGLMYKNFEMITILVDGHEFYFSTTTLRNNPDFCVTQILFGNHTAESTSHPHVARIDDNTFKIDTTVEVFKNIAHLLRKSDQPEYSKNIHNILFPKQITKKDQSIFTVSKQPTKNIGGFTVPDNASADVGKFLKGMVDMNTDNGTVLNRSDEPKKGVDSTTQNNGRNRHVYRSRKIELDTSEKGTK